jgi:uncharacterized membrane protein (UPF0127 family)
MFKNYKKIKTPIKGKGNYNLWVADTYLKKQRGLRGIGLLPRGCGMIFTYDNDVDHSFTMSGVKIPLTIIFLDKNFHVIDLVHAKPGQKRINCKSKYRYVIEV